MLRELNGIISAARCISVNRAYVLRSKFAFGKLTRSSWSNKGGKAVLAIQIPEPPYEFDALHQTPIFLLEIQNDRKNPEGISCQVRWRRTYAVSKFVLRTGLCMI